MPSCRSTPSGECSRQCPARRHRCCFATRRQRDAGEKAGRLGQRRGSSRIVQHHDAAVASVSVSELEPALPTSEANTAAMAAAAETIAISTAQRGAAREHAHCE
jgi:hypothetical protein